MYGLNLVEAIEMKPVLCMAALFPIVALAQIPPDTLTVNLGRVQAGNLQSLRADDFNPLVLCKFFVPNIGSPFIKFTCTSSTGYPSCSDYILRLKVKMLHAGLFQCTLKAYNYATGGYVANQTSTVNLNYSTIQVHLVQGAEDYLSLDGEVRAEVSVNQQGPGSAAFPCASFELLHWFLTP